MNVAFVDTSALVVILFGEPRSAVLGRKLKSFEEVFASPLLEAELLATARRESVQLDDDVLGGLRWVMPDRRLSREIARVLAIDYVRGADLWHLATALYLFDNPAAGTFITLDKAQAAIAAELGFKVR